MRTKVLQLYKQLMRYGESLEFTDKKYFRYRIKKGFRENKDLSLDDEKTINFCIEKAQKSLFPRVEYSPAAHGFRRCPKAVVTVGNNGNAFRPENFVQIRWKNTRAKLDHSRVPKLDENDLEEQFVRGSGPGGQATAKTNNAVVLKHKPTGIVVKCHETRSQWDNKKRAREILINKLDVMINGEYSLENQERALMAKKSANKARKREKMRILKAAFKEREGIE